MFNLKSPIQVLSLLSFSFSIFLFAGNAEATKKACHLHLVYENPSYVEANSTTTDSQRFLYFMRDLKGFGFEFSNMNPQAVLSDFKKQSARNLKAMIANYKDWLSAHNQRIHTPEDLGAELILWKDYFSPEGGGSFPFLPTNEARLQQLSGHSDNLWSTGVGGIGGVFFNYGVVGKPAPEFLNAVKDHGTARVILKDSFQTEWAYVLPLPGDSDFHVPGVDHRFFRFLGVFAPDLAGEFFEDLIPYLKTEMDLEQFLGGVGIFDVGSLNRDVGGIKVIERWRSRLSGVVLSLEDAATLLRFISAQEMVHFDHVSNLTAVVSGSVSSEDFHLKERPFRPPVKNKSWTSQGWRVRPTPMGTPNMTGDDFLIPNGPDL